MLSKIRLDIMIKNKQGLSSDIVRLFRDVKMWK